jgi:hypothetical protein
LGSEGIVEVVDKLTKLERAFLGSESVVEVVDGLLQLRASPHALTGVPL